MTPPNASPWSRTTRISRPPSVSPSNATAIRWRGLPPAAKASRAFSTIRRTSCILDLNLPDLDGLGVCRELRETPAVADLPIIILTARVTESDRVLGLDLGADDYITKPFSLRELKSRIRALLRRRSLDGGVPEDSYEDARLSIERGAMEVRLDGEPVRLTMREFELLWYLVTTRPRVALARKHSRTRVGPFERGRDPNRGRPRACAAQEARRRARRDRDRCRLPFPGLFVKRRRHCVTAVLAGLPLLVRRGLFSQRARVVERRPWSWLSGRGGGRDSKASHGGRDGRPGARNDA